MNKAERFFAKTAAYRAVIRDREEGALSHSYLLICQDEAWLRLYVRALAKLIMCEKGGLCGECRPCRLIDKEAFTDCDFYPEDGEKISAEMIDRIVSEKCYVKPLESEKRLFCIVGADKMNVTAQNKLLKTLEEPPANVCIILGSTGDYSLLSTVKSRVKRLEIPLFPSSVIYDELEGRFADKEKLKTVCDLCDGKPGNVEALYADDAASRALDECIRIFSEMKKSPDIARYSGKLVKKSRDEFLAFISAMRLVVRDLVFIKEGVEDGVINKERAFDLETIAERYNEGALLTISSLLGEIAASAENNGNQTMLADRLLFALLEENYRWQKL
ncbi:MAG: hypothetical protein IKC36_05945 [Clostridia bacterium]|nr:hypothetical protein [Clostridia bacterium]